MRKENPYDDLFRLCSDIEVHERIYMHKSAFGAQGIAVGIFHHKRTSHLLSAIRILCMENQLIEARILLRSLLNLYINLKWILHDDTLRRLQRYIDHETIFRKKASESAAPYSSVVFDEGSSEYQEAEKRFRSLAQKYGITSLKKVRSWSGLQIAQMAKETELVWEYDLLYSRLSEYEHSGPSSIVDYATGAAVTFVTQREDIPLILITSIDYGLHSQALSASLFGGTFTDTTFSRLRLDTLSEKYFGRKEK